MQEYDIFALMKRQYNIMILGSGGREHAFAWKIKQSPLCNTLHIAPGNAGTHLICHQENISVTNFPAIRAYAETHDIDMILVGPEQPLVEGIVDYFANDPIFIIGPDQVAAQLEGSKAFAKSFMAEMNIPTAKYGQFTSETLAEAYGFLDQMEAPYVLKADGLAAGKGVLIIEDLKEAKEALQNMFDGKFGDAGKTVVIEEFLDGIEYSMFAITDGKDYKLLPTAKDYKRIGEGDTGLNTGGMGAISPVPFLDSELYKKSVNQIIQPTIAGLQARGMHYQGFVFFGLIAVKGDPYVIEYNCRMGDPESEVVFPRLETDLVEIFAAMQDDRLQEVDISISDRHAATVMLVSGGYPEQYEKDKIINSANDEKTSLIFHAGTRLDQNNEIVTNGGRVMAITSFGDSIPQAVSQSLQIADRISFDGKYFRRDIGFDL